MSNDLRLKLLGAALAAGLAVPATAAQIFPYQVFEKELANGFRVVTVPYDSPGTLSYSIIVRTGSREEVEPGHSGFAHFFEHMMFRGTEKYSQDDYNDIVKRMGADTNGYTSNDRTVYYIVGPSAELETMMEIESDRFLNLTYDEEAFRREALAVLGEYNKNVSNPFLPLFERLRELAFTRHTYGHTTMGYLDDIKAMPGYYDYSLRFFDRFYRPENTTLLVVGDAEPQKVDVLAERYFGAWQPGYRPAEIPAEPAQTEAKSAHIDWGGPIAPHLLIGYRAPAFSDTTVDTAALDIISQLLFSDSAPLYKKLVVDEQWLDQLGGSYSDHRDPYLFVIFARLKSKDLLPEVEAAMQEAIADLQRNPVDGERLERIKSHLRYDFALGLDSPQSIARTLINSLVLTGDPGSVNRVYEQYQKITPADVQRAARELFRDSGRTSVTLWHPGEKAAPAPPIDTVVLPSPESPLVSLRLLFKAGSTHDPAGKEGLAALTGLMVAEAGTQRRDYSELVDLLYPLAATIDVATDREVTVITGEIHREKLDEYATLLREVVLEPAFDARDFTRNKEQLEAYLTTTLRASSDELLGLEMLQQVLYDGHPYGHAPEGTLAGLAAITLDDVKSFYRRHYTRANLMLGVAGGYPEGFLDSFLAGLEALPAGEASTAELPAPPAVDGRDFTLVEKSTGSVGIHFGYPIPVTRAHPDYYALLVANSFLGEHRTFHGRLMQQLRGKRGLNYGDYSYIEYYYSPPTTNNPTPNVPRRQQYFSVWVRPVVPNTAHFALRNAIYEVERLAERGMTREEFELTRDYLLNYSKLWAQTLPDRLGFLMDSRFYGTGYYIDEIDERLRSLTLEEVNAAIRRYLQADDFQAVLVTDGAAALKQALAADQPSPMVYNAPPDAEVAEEDKRIEGLPVAPDVIRIVPVDTLFEAD